jgi:peptidoglycan hydrolase-like protein with peptidoglycan-binding domain
VSDIVRQMQQGLTSVGFPSGPADGVVGPATRTAVARFQLAYGWRSITVDGVYGPQTLGALAQVQQTGRLSPNFTVGELRSKGDGTVWVHRDLLTALERLRAHVGRPLGIISGWRDVAHNRRVGGARTSQHTYGAAPELHRLQSRLSAGAHLHAGRAADFSQRYIRLQDCVNLRLFSGIGHRNGWVTHVDLRTNATPASPTVWVYG